MRKSPFIAASVAATMAAGGVAVAQAPAPSHTLQMSVIPSQAGKPTKPKTISKLKLNISNERAAGTTASRIEIFFPKTIRINTRGFRVCSEATITDEGINACPRGSRLGSGTAKAVVNPTAPTPSNLSFRNTFFVGSRSTLNIFLQQTPGDVRAVLAARIGRAGGKFGQKLTIDIPEDLQQPAAGVYSALTDIVTSLGGTTGSGSRRHGIFESIGCRGGLYDFQTRLTYVPNPTAPAVSSTIARDTVDCRK